MHPRRIGTHLDHLWSSYRLYSSKVFSEINHFADDWTVSFHSSLRWFCLNSGCIAEMLYTSSNAIFQFARSFAEGCPWVGQSYREALFEKESLEGFGIVKIIGCARFPSASCKSDLVRTLRYSRTLLYIRV